MGPTSRQHLPSRRPSSACAAQGETASAGLKAFVEDDQTTLLLAELETMKQNGGAPPPPPRQSPPSWAPAALPSPPLDGSSRIGVAPGALWRGVPRGLRTARPASARSLAPPPRALRGLPLAGQCRTDFRQREEKLLPILVVLSSGWVGAALAELPLPPTRTALLMPCCVAADKRPKT